jgi:hypothetical protein
MPDFLAEIQAGCKILKKISEKSPMVKELTRFLPIPKIMNILLKY